MFFLALQNLDETKKYNKDFILFFSIDILTYVTNFKSLS